jgi:carboxymethylenebutenolidase
MSDSERPSLQPKAEWSRREFVVAVLGAGFALAVQPVSAQTMIVTDSEGIESGEVRIPVSDGSIPAYRAMPATGGPFPTVLVVQEIFGVHEHIRDVCRRLAKLGYFAVAPELFARQGDVSKMTDINEIFAKVISRVPDAQVMSDLDATVAWARETGEANTDKLAITGFCWGGRITWLYAAHNPNLKAAVAWYGRLTGHPTPMTPKQPIDVAASLTVPVLGLYGGRDEGIPLGSVDEMREAISRGGNRSRIVVYPEAPHAFHADYRPSYREDAAEDGWRRMLEWFKANGVD